MKPNNSISIITITYQREYLLTKAVNNFLKQDYDGEKELIILNDDPFVELKINHPDISIINYDKRFPVYWIKYNIGVQKAKHELFSFWDDDNIYKPWAITTMVKCLGDKNIVWVKPYIINTKQVINDIQPNVFLARKDWFLNIGGFNIKETWPDFDFVRQTRNIGEHNVMTIPEDKIFFRWIKDPLRRKYKSDIKRKKSIFTIPFNGYLLET